MKKYIITIVDLRDGEKRIEQFDCENTDTAINKVFGTKMNVTIENSHVVQTDKNYSFTNGVMKNKPCVFSILCYTPNN